MKNEGEIIPAEDAKLMRNFAIDMGFAFLAIPASMHPALAVTVAAARSFYQRMSSEQQQVFSNELKSTHKSTGDQNFDARQVARASEVTIEAASRTDNEDKIKLFARLLRSGIDRSLINDLDDYREYVKLLDDLSPKELIILSAVNKSVNSEDYNYINDNPELPSDTREAIAEGNRTGVYNIPPGMKFTRKSLKAINTYRILNGYGMAEENTKVLLKRLENKGLLQLREPGVPYPDGYSEIQIEPTPLFEQFKDYLVNEAGEII